jgi:hypothetical protein
MSPKAQDVKIRLGSLGTAENEFESAKHEAGTDASGTVDDGSESAKSKYWTRRPRYIGFRPCQKYNKII